MEEREVWRSKIEKERPERDQAEERRDRWNIKEELEEAEARRQGEEGLSMADREELCQERNGTELRARGQTEKRKGKKDNGILGGTWMFGFRPSM